MAHQHILGYSVPENSVKDAIKKRKYNQGYFAWDRLQNRFASVSVSVYPSVCTLTVAFPDRFSPKLAQT